MRLRFLAIGLCVIALPAAAGQGDGKHYKVVEEDGTIYYGDSVPPEYAEAEKQVLNKTGVTVDVMHGKKTPEQAMKDIDDKVNARLQEMGFFS